MKTTELIEKLNNVDGDIKADVNSNKIVITHTIQNNWYNRVTYPMFDIPLEATCLGDGLSYSENWTGVILEDLGKIANLLEEYVKTPQKDRSEPKYYHFFSTAPILADSEYKYLSVNMSNGDYVLTCKNPVLPSFHTVFSEERKNEMEAKGLLVGFEPEEIK